MENVGLEEERVVGREYKIANKIASFVKTKTKVSLRC